MDGFRLGAALQRVSRHPSSIVFCSRFTPDAVGRMLHQLAISPAEVSWADMEDHDRHISDALHSTQTMSVQAEVALRLAPTLLTLDARVAYGLLAVLLDPIWNSAKELPARTTVSRRTIERSLRIARLAPLHRWCSVARVARAYTALLHENVTQIEAAAIAGYASARSLRHQYRNLADRPLRDAKEAMPQDEFVKLAARALRKPRQ